MDSKPKKKKETQYRALPRRNVYLWVSGKIQICKADGASYNMDRRGRGDPGSRGRWRALVVVRAGAVQGSLGPHEAGGASGGGDRPFWTLLGAVCLWCLTNYPTVE